MSWSLIANSAAGSADASSVSVGTFDVTGANLIIAIVCDYEGATFGTVGDSESNSYTPLTSYSGGGTIRITIAYTVNPTTSSTFTVNYFGSSTYPALLFQAWSGAAASPFDVENGQAGGLGTSFQTGSVTPSLSGALLVAGLALSGSPGGTPTINSSFTVADFVDYAGGQHFAGTSAYLVQGGAAAVNPTWSWTNSVFPAAAIAAFKLQTSTTFDWMTHATDRPVHYSKLSMIDSGPRPGRGI